MSDASFQRSHVLERPARASGSRPLPVGYGLLIAAAISIAMWIGVAWLVSRVI